MDINLSCYFYDEYPQILNIVFASFLKQFFANVKIFQEAFSLFKYIPEQIADIQSISNSQKTETTISMIGMIGKKKKRETKFKKLTTDKETDQRFQRDISGLDESRMVKKITVNSIDPL